MEKNTSRYIRHFEYCADNLMPPISADSRKPEQDVFDILEVAKFLLTKIVIIKITKRPTESNNWKMRSYLTWTIM